MLKPLPMQYLSLACVREDVGMVADLLARHQLFNPETVVLAALPNQPDDRYRHSFASAKSRLDKLRQRVSIPTPLHLPACDGISLAQLETTNQRLGDLWERCSALEEQQHEIREQQQRWLLLKRSLPVFAELDIELSLLSKPHPYMELHVGTLPLARVSRLRNALHMMPQYFVHVFHRSQDVAYIMVAGPQQSRLKLGKFLQTTGFHALEIPPEFHQHPSKINDELDDRIHDCDRQLVELAQRLDSLRTSCQDDLFDAATLLHCAAGYAELSAHIREGRAGLMLMQGWIPQRAVATVSAELQHRLATRFVLFVREPQADEAVPTLLDNPLWLRGFEKLVSDFGVPRYHEIDPTLLFAVTALLMFGMMFGDVGHGAVIALAGWFGRAKLDAFKVPVIGAGLMSMAFGFIYGSIFGYEDWLPALWLSPIHHPMLMLGVAVFWGVFLIISACLLKIYNLWQQRKYHQALFDAQGVAGVALYIAGLAAVLRGSFGALEMLAIAAPLLSILAYQWQAHSHAGLGERIIVVAVEGFETLMSFVSNTLSYMRVAAFSLNHAALALAVFTLAHSMDGFGHWAAILLGNVFIIVVEGAIVGIQVLRLEYYEGFVRFFSGDGRAFKPLSIKV